MPSRRSNEYSQLLDEIIAVAQTADSPLGWISNSQLDPSRYPIASKYVWTVTPFQNPSLEDRIRVLLSDSVNRGGFDDEVLFQIVAAKDSQQWRHEKFDQKWLVIHEGFFPSLSTHTGAVRDYSAPDRTHEAIMSSKFDAVLVCAMGGTFAYAGGRRFEEVNGRFW